LHNTHVRERGLTVQVRPMGYCSTAFQTGLEPDGGGLTETAIRTHFGKQQREDANSVKFTPVKENLRFTSSRIQSY
jgi:hypothetical protein